MADPTYTTLITPLTRAQVVDSMLTVLKSPDFGLPVASWGAFDEPLATLNADAQVLADLSVKIAEIAKSGVTGDASGEILTLHAKDVFAESRLLGVPTKGTITFTETAGTPQSWADGALIFTSRLDPSIVLRNSGAVTLAGLGTTSFEIRADSAGANANLQASDLVLSTPIPGVTMTVATGLAWITQSGTNDESDEKLRLRCSLKWDTLATTGPENAYKKWAFDSSASVNRVFVQEDPGAIYPSPAVTIVVASPTGEVTSTVLTTVTTYIQAKRPLGVLVSVISAATTAFTLKGTVTVKASKRAAAETAINLALDTWFSGQSIIVNGEAIAGLQIGDRIRVSQLIEIVMSAAGVVSFTPLKADGSIFTPETDDVVLAGNAVAALTRGLTYVEVTG